MRTGGLPEHPPLTQRTIWAFFELQADMPASSDEVTFDTESAPRPTPSIPATALLMSPIELLLLQKLSEYWQLPLEMRSASV